MLTDVNPDFAMPSQSAAFRRTVAARMEAYQQRIAERIRRQLERRGEQPRDLAYHLGINPRTPERWVAGDSVPQPRHFRGMADYFGVEVSDLKPDLDAEERELQTRLNRIETGLESQLQLLLAIAQRLGVEGAEPPLEQTERALDEILQWLERAASEREAAPSEAPSRAAGDGSSREQR